MATTRTPAAALARRLARGLSTTTAKSTAAKTTTAAAAPAPDKLVPDYLRPMPSHLLALLLADLAPLAAAGPASSPAVQQPAPVLPQGHHLVYFPLQTPPSGLAADGADADHEPPPPPSHPGRRRRRLWAGGELVFADGWRDRLRLDARAWACRETVEGVAPGPAAPDRAVVAVRRAYGLGHEAPPGACDVLETRTLVFAPVPDDAGTAVAPRRAVRYPHAPSLRVAVRPPSATHLFYFSALTLNAHAIHLDARYAAAVEGHRALLVHGPLALALMLRVLAAATAARPGGGHPAGVVRRLTYRNYAPLYVAEPMAVCVRRLADPSMWHVWVEGPDGALAVKGTAEVEIA